MVYAVPSSALNRSEQCFTLGKSVSAIQTFSGRPGDDVEHLGLMTQLPTGAELRIEGPGFNERTVRIRCGSACYYVFWEDLEQQRKPAAHAAGR